MLIRSATISLTDASGSRCVRYEGCADEYVEGGWRRIYQPSAEGSDKLANSAPALPAPRMNFKRRRHGEEREKKQKKKHYLLSAKTFNLSKEVWKNNNSNKEVETEKRKKERQKERKMREGSGGGV